MSNKSKRKSYLCMAAAIVILGLLGCSYERGGVTQPVNGWYHAGSDPDNYLMGVTTSEHYTGKACAFIQSKSNENGFGTYMQTCLPGAYRGKSVRMSAYIKTINAGWAAMWFRTDGEEKKMLSFDNMGNRPIKGTTDWKQYDIVLDVPDSTKDMAFGVLLTTGEVYFDDVKFEILGPATGNTGPKTETSIPSAPENLDFEK